MLFIDRLKAIKNIMDCLIHLFFSTSYTQVFNFKLSYAL